MPGNTKEVDFHTYCATCKYKDTDESEEPCTDCLAEPCKIDSKIPVYYKENE